MAEEPDGRAARPARRDPGRRLLGLPVRARLRRRPGRGRRRRSSCTASRVVVDPFSAPYLQGATIDYLNGSRSPGSRSTTRTRSPPAAAATRSRSRRAQRPRTQPAVAARAAATSAAPTRAELSYPSPLCPLMRAAMASASAWPAAKNWSCEVSMPSGYCAGSTDARRDDLVADDDRGVVHPAGLAARVRDPLRQLLKSLCALRRELHGHDRVALARRHARPGHRGLVERRLAVRLVAVRPRRLDQRRRAERARWAAAEGAVVDPVADGPPSRRPRSGSPRLRALRRRHRPRARARRARPGSRRAFARSVASRT